MLIYSRTLLVPLSVVSLLTCQASSATVSASKCRSFVDTRNESSIGSAMLQRSVATGGDVLKGKESLHSQHENLQMRDASTEMAKATRFQRALAMTQQAFRKIVLSRVENAVAQLQPHAKPKLEASTPGILSDAELEGNEAFATVHGLASHVVVPCTVVFLLSLAVSHVLTLSEYTKWIPESAAILAVSLCLGEMMKALVAAGVIQNQGAFALGAAAVLNLALLPIIIFASGWTLRRADFIYQFNPIMIFAVCGTVMSTLIVGWGSYKMSQFGLHVVTDWRSNMVFAALISAVDPVATLCTYKSLAVDPLLDIMVFGESTINDAVAVVIFVMVNEGWDNFNLKSAVFRVSRLLFGSMIFAWVVSLLLLLVMRFTKMRHNRHAAILFTWITPFFVYALAESTGLFSGIIATLVSGIVFGTYGRFHLDEDAAGEADNFFDLTAGLADKAVFMLCGASTAMITSSRGIYFGCCAVGLCLVARVLSTVPCGCLANFYKRCVGDAHILSWQHLFMMCHGGLRGGIALVLALEIDATWCPFKATILNGTFIVICTLLLICGGSTEFFLRRLGIPMGDQVDSSKTLALEQKGQFAQALESFDQAITQLTTGETATQSNLLVNQVGSVHTHS